MLKKCSVVFLSLIFAGLVFGQTLVSPPNWNNIQGDPSANSALTNLIVEQIIYNIESNTIINESIINNIQSNNPVTNTIGDVNYTNSGIIIKAGTNINLRTSNDTVFVDNIASNGSGGVSLTGISSGTVVVATSDSTLGASPLKFTNALAIIGTNNTMSANALVSSNTILIANNSTLNGGPYTDPVVMMANNSTNAYYGSVTFGGRNYNGGHHGFVAGEDNLLTHHYGGMWGYDNACDGQYGTVGGYKSTIINAADGGVALGYYCTVGASYAAAFCGGRSMGLNTFVAGNGANSNNQSFSFFGDASSARSTPPNRNGSANFWVTNGVYIEGLGGLYVEGYPYGVLTSNSIYNIGITNNLDTVIRTLPKQLNGYTMTVNLTNGTYSLTNRVTIRGFHNGVFQLFGPASTMVSGSCVTNQSCILDVTGVPEVAAFDDLIPIQVSANTAVIKLGYIKAIASVSRATTLACIGMINNSEINLLNIHVTEVTNSITKGQGYHARGATTILFDTCTVSGFLRGAQIQGGAANFVNFATTGTVSGTSIVLQWAASASTNIHCNYGGGTPFSRLTPMIPY